MSKLRFHTIVFFIFRQVLSLMVESLTQFFEENGLSNSTSHAVLDEQIYSKYYTPFWFNLSLNKIFDRNLLAEV